MLVFLVFVIRTKIENSSAQYRRNLGRFFVSSTQLRSLYISTESLTFTIFFLKYKKKYGNFLAHWKFHFVKKPTIFALTKDLTLESCFVDGIKKKVDFSSNSRVTFASENFYAPV